MVSFKEPFADYSDFDDCVAKNQDKGDPEAYCASIKRKVEGENMKLPKEQILKNKLYAEKTGTKLDEDGYIIVEENKPIVFIGTVNIQENDNTKVTS